MSPQLERALSPPALSSRRGSGGREGGREGGRPQCGLSSSTVLRPACPATSCPSPPGLRQWPASLRPPLYSPHWPIVPPCPNPRPIRSSGGGAARHCALGRSAAGPALEPGQRPIVSLVHCAAAHSSLFSGESCTRISGGLEPGLDGTIVRCNSCTLF